MCPLGSESKWDEADLRRILEEALGTPFFSGNRVEVLRNGVEIFPAMLRAIREAEVSIDFLTFVYWTGGIAERVAETLAERARGGVRTRVLLDAVGARRMPSKLFEELQASGAEVAWFRPLARWKLWQADHRTHRKILVCDGKIGFTGGVGIAREWEGDARRPSEWRDSHFRIEGPAVRGLAGAFLDNWLEAQQDGFATAPPVESRLVGEVPVQVIRSNARVGWSDTTSLLHTLVRLAEERIRITTAYFVPDPFDLDALIAAAERAVSVEVLVPGPYVDTRVSQLAGQGSYDRLLAAGIRIWEFQPTMLHAKIVTIDRVAAVVGSPNFNRRSMSKDDEIALTLVHRETVDELDEHFDRDLESAVELSLDSWRERGALQKVMERAAKLVRPEV